MVYLNNKTYQINWTENFKYELDDIYNYLLHFLNLPLITEKLHSKIVTSLSSLQYFPERFPKLNLRKNYKYKNLHRLIIDNYIVIFEINKDIRSSFYSTYFSRSSRLFKSIIIFKYYKISIHKLVNYLIYK